MRSFQLVEFDRRPMDRHGLIGFVLGWSDSLTMLHVVSDHLFELNGYSVIRNRDVRRWRELDAELFTARALKLKRVRAKAPDGVSIETWEALLKSANRAFPLVTIHQERTHKGACYVGRALAFKPQSFALKNLDPDATWAETKRYRFRDLTMVDFGGRYEDALYRVSLASTAPSGHGSQDR